MNEAALTTTLAGLVARVEALQTENADLRAKNVACADAVAKLVAKVENLHAINAELGLASRQPKPTDYRKRPPVMQGRTVQSNVGCGPLYITLNEDESGRPFEVFFKLGKSGSCQQSYLEALGVAISVGLRYGADPQKFIEKFEGMRCPNPKMRDASGPSTLSCADGISQGLAKALALALPLADLNPRGEADVVAVAEPLPTFTRQEKAEQSANQMSIDLIGQLPSNGGTQMASLQNTYRIVDAERSQSDGDGRRHVPEMRRQSHLAGRLHPMSAAVRLRREVFVDRRKSERRHVNLTTMPFEQRRIG